MAAGKEVDYAAEYAVWAAQQTKHATWDDASRMARLPAAAWDTDTAAKNRS